MSRCNTVKNRAGNQQMDSSLPNVYELAQRRLKFLFEAFDNIYVSFSGGKDSSVLLNLCIDYIRRHGLDRKIGVFHMDYEIQYRDTVAHVDQVLASNADILEVYRNKHRFRGERWIRQCKADNICNAYPIYDWLTTDVWTANGKFGWAYNRLYDLFYQAGVPLENQRVASPFISPAIPSLSLYRAIDPDTWGKMVSRVNGVNFAAHYGKSPVAGWQSVSLPKGLTWEKYMNFLLTTLPAETRRNYLEKLSVSIRFWRDKGGSLSDQTIARLQKAGIPIRIGEKSGYRTDKKPVRMEYLDDIDVPEFSQLPTFKRICICILRNDHACKYMGFSPNKNETLRRKKIMEKYESLLRS